MADRSPLSLSVLGPIEVVRGDTLVRSAVRKQRRVLAVLAMHANEVVSSDRLIDVLWGETPPASASHTLQSLVSRLRRGLGTDRVETVAPGYRLRVNAAEVDSLRFEDLVRLVSGRIGPTRRRRASRRHWRCGAGRPYAEFADEEFAFGRGGAARGAATDARSRSTPRPSSSWVDPREVIGALEAEIAAEPFRERLRAVLMLALARAGRPVEALRAFDAYRGLSCRGGGRRSVG